MGEFTCPAGHKHAATSTCYTLHRCRCADCRAGNRNRAEARRKQIAYGRHQPRLADATAARKHMLRLRQQGIPAHVVATAAGISRGAAQHVAAGSRPVVNAATATKILAVTAEAALATKVPAAGAHRRLQALTYVGWTNKDIERQMDAGATITSWILRHDRITQELHQRVCAVYDALWNQTPPDTIGNRRAAARARSRGWAPPLAWDDEAIDDPDARPANWKEAA